MTEAMNQTMSEADLIRLVEQFEVRHVIQSYHPILLFSLSGFYDLKTLQTREFQSYKI